MPKPSEADKEYFRAVVPHFEGVEIKPMFGNLGAFVNGNMFAGLFGSSVGVKLDAADRDELVGIQGSGPFGPEDRPMGGYVALPPEWRDDPGEAAGWVGRAYDYVSSLPPKPHT